MLLQQKLLAAGIRLTCLWVPLAGLGAGAIAAEGDSSSAVEPEVTTIEEGSVPSAQEDEQPDEASRLLSEGFNLYVEGSADSLRQAAELCEQALSLAKDSGMQQQEMNALICLGLIYDDEGKKETALEYYQQSLLLTRALEDRQAEAATLNNIGFVYESRGEKETALEYFQQSLLLSQAIDDRKAEATTLSNVGAVYDSQGQREAALDYYQQSLPLSRAVGDQQQEASTLNNIGLVYDSRGEKATALEYYQQSLPLRRAVGDRRGEASTLNNIGLVYDSQGEKATALDYYQQSLPLSRAVGDRQQEASTLSNIGAVYDSQGEKEIALDYYQRSLPLSRAVGDRQQEAATLNNIGLVYDSQGDKETALEYFQQSLPLSRTIGDRQQQAVTLNNIGFVYDSRGEKETALDYYQQSLPLKRAVGDRRGEAVTLINIGAVYDSQGEKEAALEYYQQSLPLSRAVGDREGEAATLSNIGRVYSSVGKKETALEYFQQSLPLSQAIGDHQGEATTLNNIGALYDNQGEEETALDYYQQSLSLRRAIGDRQGEAVALNNIGALYDNQGEKETALEYYQQSLPLSQAVGDRLQEAITLSNTGRLYDDIGEKETALEYYRQSLPLSQAVGDRQTEANTHKNIARTYQSQNRLSEALAEVEAAISLIEDLRTDISPGDLRTTYFSTVQDYYQLKIDLLMQLNQPDDAFDTSEAARARTLLELLNEANVNIRQGVNPTLLAQEQTLQANLQQLEKRRIVLGSGEHTPAEAEALDQQSDETLQQLDQVIAQIRRLSPAYAELVQPQPLSLTQIQQQVLDADTVLVQYALGEEQSYLWLVGKDQFQTYTLPSSAEIEQSAKAFREAILEKGSPGDVKRSGDMLVSQILSELPAWTEGKRLLIAGDGILSELPFAALPTPNSNKYTPLLAEHEILSQPSITAVDVLRKQLANRPERPPSIAVLADPVYGTNDDRVQQKTATTLLSSVSDTARNLTDLDLRTISRLPNTRNEASNILKLAAANNLKSTEVLDFDADNEWITDPSLNQYSIVHLATHGFINPNNPQLSGIVLSLVDSSGELRENGFLRLHDIFNLKLSAELVVLSACQTGLGEDVQGEGIVGLSRGFMYAGAKRVAVSLWNVDDEATASLMTRFYAAMLQDNLSPAAAMRAAQLAEWKAGREAYLWAAFTLQGEWQ